MYTVIVLYMRSAGSMEASERAEAGKPEGPELFCNCSIGQPCCTNLRAQCLALAHTGQAVVSTLAVCCGVAVAGGPENIATFCPAVISALDDQTPV